MLRAAYSPLAKKPQGINHICRFYRYARVKTVTEVPKFLLMKLAEGQIVWLFASYKTATAVAKWQTLAIFLTLLTILPLFLFI